MKSFLHAFLIVSVCCAASVATGAAEKVPPVVLDALMPAPANSVHLTGWWSEAMATCQHGRIDGQNTADLVAPFAVRAENRMWRSEFWGKWFSSAALAERHQPRPELRRRLEQSVHDLIATQTADGAITTYKREPEFTNWDTWGRKYTLLGLIAAYDMTGDAAILAAACRHADRVVSHYGPGEANIIDGDWWNGLAAGSILEPIVQLYRRTGDERYLKFARYMVSEWQTPRGPDLVRKANAGISVFKMFSPPDPTKNGYFTNGSSKAYEMMSCYEGLVELYRATGEQTFGDAAKHVFADIRATEITVLGSGSSLERWCNGRMRQSEPVVEWMETCVTTTWIKFAAQLLRLTGDARYADDIELAAYNALLAAQKTDGTWWGHYSPLEGERTPAPAQCGMHMNCCVASGPRALFLLPALTAMSSRDGVALNFFEPATLTLPVPSGQNVRLAVASNYPHPGPMVVTVMPDAVEKFVLSVRIPGWSRTATLTVNGQSVGPAEPGTYARIERTWTPGDKVELQLDFATRRIADPGRSSKVAIMRGPVVFALDKRLVQPATGLTTGSVAADAHGVVAAKPGAEKFARMVIEVPVESEGKRATLRLCDYASAGTTWSADSTLRVWLPQPVNLQEPLAGLHRPVLPK